MAEALKDGVDAMLGIECRSEAMERNKHQVIEPYGVTLRHIMQTLGTEWGRNCINPDLWVMLAENKWRKAKQDGISTVIIPDVRFPNEQQCIHRNEGSIVYIIREGQSHDTMHNHASEQILSPQLGAGDTTLINRGNSIVQLRRDLLTALIGTLLKGDKYHAYLHL